MCGRRFLYAYNFKCKHDHATTAISVQCEAVNKASSISRNCCRDVTSLSSAVAAAAKTTARLQSLATEHAPWTQDWRESIENARPETMKIHQITRRETITHVDGPYAGLN